MTMSALIRRTALLLLAWQTGFACITRASVELTSAQEQTTVIVVVGAGGEDDFTKEFTSWAGLWQTNCAKAGARFIGIGLDADKGQDLEKLKATVESERKDGDSDLWLVLLGHGTFDGKQAKFNLRGPDLVDAQLAGWLAPFQRPLAIIDTSSSSGPFLPTLSKAGRVVITATRSGSELNYSRFGGLFSKAFSGTEADLDKDGQVSLLEAWLWASAGVAEFYKTEGRLSTEHSLLDDNGDTLGTPSDWFRGVRAVKKPDQGASVDGRRAHQLHLIRSEQERRMTPETRAKRDELEIAVFKLHDDKPSMPEKEYYQKLEALMLQLAKLYESAK